MGPVPAYEQSVCVWLGVPLGTAHKRSNGSVVNGVHDSCAPSAAVNSKGLLLLENGFFGCTYLTWHEVRWIRDWCEEAGLSDPFIGWAGGGDSGGQCDLGPDNEHTRLAKEWCRAIEEKQPEIATIGNALLDGMGVEDILFPREGPMFPDEYLGALSSIAWNLCNVAKLYAILKNGIEHGDTLAYC